MLKSTCNKNPKNQSFKIQNIYPKINPKKYWTPPPSKNKWPKAKIKADILIVITKEYLLFNLLIKNFLKNNSSNALFKIKKNIMYKLKLSKLMGCFGLVFKI
jgi:hypothetical protein